MMMNRWVRFLFGLLLILAFAGWCAYGPDPAGIAGDIVRHNREQNIPVTALFYTEAEMPGRAGGLSGEPASHFTTSHPSR